MKHKQNKHIPIILLSVLFFFACMKDKGNYEYHEVDDPVIVKGIDSVYLVDVNEEALVIDPEITTPDGNPIDTSLFSYQWKIDQDLSGGEDYATLYPLSTSPRLEIKKGEVAATIAGNTVRNNFMGAFSAFFRVTDKKTGLSKDTYFKFIFGSISSNGWLLLCEQPDGSSRLGMISAIYNDSLISDVLKTTRSAFPTTGKPRFITIDYQYQFTPNSGPHPFIGTSTNFALLGPDTLEYSPPRYDLRKNISGLPAQANFSTARFFSSGYLHYLYNDGSIYWLEEYDGNQFNAINSFNNTKFRASEQMAIYSGQGAIVFNEETKTFLRSPNADYCLELPAGTLFNFSTKQELRYITFADNFNGGEIFAILDSTTKVNLARFSGTGLQSYYKEILAPDIGKATQFAVDDVYGYVFYSVNGKLYQYNMIEQKARLVQDFGNNKITLIKNFTNLQDLSGQYFNTLVVCTYNEADISSGSLELFTPPNLNGDVELVKSIKKTGKIVDVAHK
ncbi:MAG: PKD-like family lipoprotein [Pseudobacter sp.]|uniref:PKD-like family lipoprotein n=1 Tax=Pseudobacter sp. TaxID=2045420 RepID=UPI003F80A982